MNSLQFNTSGLEEMTFAEMQKTDGGTEGPGGTVLRFVAQEVASWGIGQICSSIYDRVVAAAGHGTSHHPSPTGCLGKGTGING